MTLPLFVLFALILTALLVHIQYWCFSTGMTKVRVDKKTAPEDFPVVCMNGPITPLMKSKAMISFDVSHFYDDKLPDWLIDYSCLLPAKRLADMRFGDEIEGWLVVKDIGAHKQLVSVGYGRSGHGLVTRAGWYIADNRGYTPLYYAHYLLPAVVARSFLISAGLCFLVPLILRKRRVRASPMS